MANRLSRSATGYMIFIAIITWLSLALQLYIMTGNKLSNGFALFVATCNFFSYFTVLTNLLVALSLSFILLRPSSSLVQFFSKPATLSAITLYIFIVGLTYNMLLRTTWAPRGVQKWVDEALHVFVPLLFIVFWAVFVPKGSLKWTHPFRWLIYPVIYLTYALLRGEFTGFHAYPFINTAQLGYGRVLLNAGGLMIVLIVSGLIIVGVDKLMSRSQRRVFS